MILDTTTFFERSIAELAIAGGADAISGIFRQAIRKQTVPVSVISGGVLCVLGCAICALLLPAVRAYDAEST